MDEGATANAKLAEPTASDRSSSASKPAGRKSAKKRTTLKSLLVEYVSLAIVAVLLASIIRNFLGLAFYIPSASMYPTLKVNDRVVVSRLSYRLHDPERGDVIVFRNPDYVEQNKQSVVERAVRSMFEVVGVRQPADKNFIKRIVGLPGDVVAIHDNAVWINGKKLPEPYLADFRARNGVLDWEDQAPFAGKIPAKHYWMMGDNRDDSRDSRFFGPVQRSAIVGKAVYRVWPFNRLAGL